jgi:hypothetical protein
MEANMDDLNAPATKGDVKALEARLTEATKTDLQALEERLTAATKTDLQALEERLTEVIRDNQTEVLKAFYSFAQTADAKFKDGENSDLGLRQRLSAVETRLTEIERRLMSPPTQ